MKMCNIAITDRKTDIEYRCEALIILSVELFFSYFHLGKNYKNNKQCRYKCGNDVSLLT